jgi:hypothetical protein
MAARSASTTDSKRVKDDVSEGCELVIRVSIAWLYCIHSRLRKKEFT